MKRMAGVELSGRAGGSISKMIRWKLSSNIFTPKTFLFFILALCVMSVSGCVYLRILEVKKQFNQFDKYIMVDKQDGLTLSFLNPVLYDEDIKWLGFPPASQKTELGIKTWKHLIEKIYNKDQQEKGSYDIVFNTTYKNEKLNTVYFPESYFHSISKDFFISLFKYIGQSNMDVDQKNKTISHTGENDINKKLLSLVTQQDLMQEAGIPYLIERKNGTNSLEYRYQLKSDLLSDDSHEKSGAEYILKFTFSKHDALITIAGKIPLLGDIKFDLGDSELDAAVN